MCRVAFMSHIGLCCVAFDVFLVALCVPRVALNVALLLLLGGLGTEWGDA